MKYLAARDDLATKSKALLLAEMTESNAKSELSNNEAAYKKHVDYQEYVRKHILKQD